jgi:hypothetical protein
MAARTARLENRSPNIRLVEIVKDDEPCGSQELEYPRNRVDSPLNVA